MVHSLGYCSGWDLDASLFPPTGDLVPSGKVPGVLHAKFVTCSTVVTSNIQPNAIVTGNPARVIGYFDTKSVGLVYRTVPPPADGFPSITQTTVEGVALRRLKRVEDIRGNLLVGEFERELPFAPARFFTIFDVPGTRVRGEHAHRHCKQFLICLSGTCSIVIDDGRNREEIPVNTPDFGAYIPPMIWMTLYKFSSNALLLVFASSYYDPDDYIRDYEVYLRPLDNNALQNDG